MNPEYLINLLEVVKKKNIIDQNSDWSNGSTTYFKEIKLELDEVEEELDSGKECYLEDELGDVLWDYLNLLVCLENEGKITLSRVFERSLEKYSERIHGIEQGRFWADIKKIQKEKLSKEQAEQSLKSTKGECLE